MPVSHDLRCLFVHVPKTGGTSIETALDMRPSRKGEDRERLFGRIESERLLRLELGSAYLQHLTLAEIQRVHPEEPFAGYFSFAIVRNPWDRLVSSFSHPDGHLHRIARARGIELDGLDFAAYARATASIEHAHLRPQSDYVTDADGKVCVDYLGRFERLADSFAEVCRRLGIECSLPVKKKSKRRAAEGYRAYYTEETRALVAQRYARDIELFQYLF
ncbi:MAG: sulfotransferase family 2 domain-containing protein [Myxococcota bacterium]|nr:sulfotransferase family 2 domain-containing protein [Myxococcota bacterium]